MELLTAVQLGNHAVVEDALSKGQCDVTVADDRGYTAAHWAASLDDVRMVLLFLRHHPDLAAAVTKRGMTILHVAIMNTARRTVDLLLELSHDNAIPMDINARNQWLETPLHLAATMGQKDVASLLIYHGAGLYCTDSWGRTPKNVAAEHGETDMTVVLTSCDPAASALEADREVPRVEIVDPVSADIRRRIHEELMEQGHRPHLTQVNTVVKQMFKDSCEQRDTTASPSVKQASDIRLYDASVLAPAAKKRKALSQQLEYPGDFDAVVDMLSQPDVYDPAGKDMFGVAAIHKFSAWNKPEFLAILCAKLTVEELNMRGGDNGFSCIHFCIEMGAFQSLQFFMEFGAKVDIALKDNNGMSPLELARKLGNSVAEELLLVGGHSARLAEAGIL